MKSHGRSKSHNWLLSTSVNYICYSSDFLEMSAVNQISSGRSAERDSDQWSVYHWQVKYLKGLFNQSRSDALLSLCSVICFDYMVYHATCILIIPNFFIVEPERCVRCCTLYYGLPSWSPGVDAVSGRNYLKLKKIIKLKLSICLWPVNWIQRAPV